MSGRAKRPQKERQRGRGARRRWSELKLRSREVWAMVLPRLSVTWCVFRAAHNPYLVLPLSAGASQQKTAILLGRFKITIVKA